MAIFRTALLVAAFLFGTAAQALRASEVRSGHVSVELVALTDSVQSGGELPNLLLVLRHDAGWHSYWVSSTTGYATTIQFEDLPQNVRVIPQWPVPEIHESGGIVDYVYTGETDIPVFLSGRIPDTLKPGDFLHLRAKVSWLACKEECVPGEALVTLDLPVVRKAPATNPALRTLLARAFTRIPLATSRWEFSATRDHDTIRLLATRTDDRTAKPGELYFFSADGSVLATASQSQKWLSDRQVELTLPLSGYAKTPLSVLTGVLRSTYGFDDRVSAALIFQPVVFSLPKEEGSGFAAALFFGVLGGLILNLMPCVFPVLGLKVMSFARQAGRSRRAVLLHAAVFTSGVLAALWALAGVILALRGAGEAVGWGFQLQNPYVLFAGVVFFFLFGLNLLGVFEIGLGAGAAAGQLEGRGGLLGAFLSGLVAVIVATPCSAPFLGTAVGFAFTSSAPVLFAVFTAVGLGFALPYFLLAAFPALLRRLPKPGVWMLRLKQALSLLLFGTVAYLVWVLQSFYVEGWFEVGRLRVPLPLVTLGLSLFLLLFAAILYGRFSRPERSRRSRVSGIGAALLLFALGLLWGWPREEMVEGRFSGSPVMELPAPAFSGTSDKPAVFPWRPGLAELLAAQGRTVYVDFTARWCATCQVNKRLVFGSTELRDYFRAHKVYVLEADWTRRDEVISAELARWNRYAVPFNVIYAPGRPPRELPTVLTPGIVLDAMKEPDAPAKP